MNPATFLHNVARIVNGYPGFKKSVPIPLTSITAADGTALTGTCTTVGRTAVETSFMSLNAAANSTSLGTFTFMVPRDYDASVDKMYFRFLANSGGTTNAPAIDATMFQKKVGTALSSDLNPTISAAISKTAATTDAGWVEVKAEGLGLVPGSGLNLIFTTGAHTSDTVVVYAFEVVYYSDLAYYEPAER